jgi:hypothetical protein
MSAAEPDAGKSTNANMEFPMPEMSPSLTEIEGRIEVLRENIRELVEQAAAFSGAADEELVSQRIAEQEAQLELLTRQRDELVQQKS